MSYVDTNSKEVALRKVISQLIDMIKDDILDDCNTGYQVYIRGKIREIEEQVKNI